MKKIFSIFAAVLFAGSMMADVVTLTMSDYAAAEFSAKGISVTTAKNNGSTAPTYNANGADLRIYAKGSITLSSTKTITAISFEISTAGKKRLAPLTTSVGSVSVAGDPDFTATWEGSAKEITITVGDQAEYGTDGASKAGQLDFTAITVTLDGEGGGEGGEGGEGEEGEYTYDEEDANFNVNFAKYTIDDTYLASWGSVYVEAEDDDNNYIILDITLPEGATGLTAGTYNVVVVEDDEYPYQSVTAGYYYNDEDGEGAEPSFAAVYAEDGESYANIWYIVSGTVVVDENSAITVNAKNSKGKDVKAVLAEEAEPDEDDPTVVESSVVATKAVKTLENGMIVIERNGIRHNVLGQIVR